MKLAVLGCSSSKHNYSCSSKEMYSKSLFKRIQLNFLEQAYDKVLILSAQYGIVELQEVIEPYELSFDQRKRVKKERNIATSQYKEIWGEKVINQLKNFEIIYSKIDLHISNSYYSPIKDYCSLNPVFYKVSQQINPGENKKRYIEALEYYNKNNIINLNIIEEKRKSSNPETEKWFYHPNGEAFLGYTRGLIKKYPELDEGTIHMLSKSKINHHKGWVIDKSLLDKLYKTDSGQWRIRK